MSGWSLGLPSSSAARSRMAARSDGRGGLPDRTRRSAAHVERVIGCLHLRWLHCTWPTTSRGSARVEHRGRGCSPGRADPSSASIIGSAQSLCSSWPASALDSDARRCSFDRSMPLELMRVGCHRGRAATGCAGVASPKPPSLRGHLLRSAVIGSATSSSSGRLWHRRYGSRTRCWRRFPADDAPDTPTAFHGCRPVHRCDMDGSVYRRPTLPTTCSYSGSPMPCRHWNSYWPG
jgi:hypothetical protein